MPLVRVAVPDRSLALPGVVLKGNPRDGLFYEVLRKERVYINDPSEAPSGARVEQGERGGMYYDGHGRSGAAVTSPSTRHGASQDPAAAHAVASPESGSPSTSDTAPLADRAEPVSAAMVTHLQPIGETGVAGGIQLNETNVIDLKPGVFPDVPGLSPTRAVYKTVGAESITERLCSDINDLLGWGIVPPVYDAGPDLPHPYHDDPAHVMRWVDDAGFGGQAQIAADVPGLMQPTVYGGSTFDIDDLAEPDSQMLKDFVTMRVFDLLVGNEDRHDGNWIVDKEHDKIWAIDNGLAFEYPSAMSPHILDNTLYRDIYDDADVRDTYLPIMRKIAKQRIAEIEEHGAELQLMAWKLRFQSDFHRSTDRIMRENIYNLTQQVL